MLHIDDIKLVRRLKRNDESALELIIHTYTGYVSAVISNQLGSFSDISLVEELVSDVFFELWRRREGLRTFHLRGWLGATARNKARSFLRIKRIDCVSTDEDIILVSEDNAFDSLAQKEQSRVINSALEKIGEAEREVIVRYYYYNQSVRCISGETGTNIETVKSRLRRGREKLKRLFEEGGYFS